MALSAWPADSFTRDTESPLSIGFFVMRPRIAGQVHGDAHDTPCRDLANFVICPWSANNEATLRNVLAETEIKNNGKNSSKTFLIMKTFRISHVRRRGIECGQGFNLSEFLTRICHIYFRRLEKNPKKEFAESQDLAWPRCRQPGTKD